MEKTEPLNCFMASRLSKGDFVAYENLYRFEQELMTRVALGLTPVNTRSIPAIGNSYFLELMPLSLRSLQNQFSIYAALGAERAIESGVDIRIAFLICGYYQKAAEAVSSAEEVDVLAEAMLEMFSGKVREFQIPPDVPGHVREAMLFIRQNIQRPLKIHEVARQIGRSRSQLDRDFRNSLGISPSEFQMREKFRNAKAFLQYTDMSVTEVSQNVGFSSSSHFCNTFVKWSGMTPSRFRAQFSPGLSGHIPQSDRLMHVSNIAFGHTDFF
ncbi:MAG: AraC family transcriptional regulator [Clostridiales bacterium]|nr:AraC family transcriptional regulator [Clostridiales bacterium]